MLCGELAYTYFIVAVVNFRTLLCGLCNVHMSKLNDNIQTIWRQLFLTNIYIVSRERTIVLNNNPALVEILIPTACYECYYHSYVTGRKTKEQSRCCLRNLHI